MTPSREYLADMAADLAHFLQRHGVAFETFAAHLRLDILSPREAWALRKFAAISGGDTTGLLVDLKNKLFTPNLATIVPQLGTASVTGTAIDMVDCDGPAFPLLSVGAVSGTSPTLAVKFQSCPTAAGTFADVGTPGAAFPTVTASTTLRTPGFRPNARFVRALATIGGGSPSFFFCVVLEGQLKARN